MRQAEGSGFPFDFLRTFTAAQGEAMVDKEPRRTAAARHQAENDRGYERHYLARKHGITRTQAEELIVSIGDDREKLNAAAVKLTKR